jgi:hypothetical protein
MAGQYQPEQIRAQLHDAFYGALIDKIRADRYPSSTMMDMVEEGMEGHELQEYVGALLEKVEADRFPSVNMLRRIQNLLS